jgi:hypothetical protein
MILLRWGGILVDKLAALLKAAEIAAVAAVLSDQRSPGLQDFCGGREVYG